MTKAIKTIFIIGLCIAWVGGTNYKFLAVNSVGALLTYKTGLLQIPLQSSDMQLKEANYEMNIYIDSVGIPYIYGNEESAAAFGLGYMHAKDRYFQMELMSRMVLGQLSEIFGANGIQSDKFWIPFEFEKKAVSVLEEYRTANPELHNYLMAYAEGVNEYLKNNKVNDPLYTIFNVKPFGWKPHYSILTTWYMSRNLAYFDYHVEQQEMLVTLPDEVKDFFFPMNPEGLKTIIPLSEKPAVTTAAVYEDIHVTPYFRTPFTKGQGSNSWAINSSKSKTNKSILANDPHLFLTLPGAFYEAGLRTPSLNVYGYTIPGVPVIVSGHNNTISWGITNGEWDLVDRYLLKVKDDSLYYCNNKWMPFMTKNHTIKVKGGEPISFKARATIHGNVMVENDTIYYAQKWYPARKSYSVKALYGMMHSNNWKTFKTELKAYDFPPQNFIYSDINDTIGIVCAGKLPNRIKGFAGGVLDGTKEPLHISFNDTLWAIANPEESFLFSANQQPVQHQAYFGAHWHKNDFRVNRIYNYLRGKNDWTVRSTKAMQLDEVDSSFPKFLQIMKRYPVSESYNHLLNPLKSWNGKMDKDSRAAMIYEILGKSMALEASGFSHKSLNIQMAPSNKYLMEYLDQDTFELQSGDSKKQLFVNILNKADSILYEQFGNQVDNKSYKDISGFTIPNIGFLPGLGVFVEGLGGNINTININSSVRPVFRFVFEMNADKIKGYTVFAGGQSGKVNSKNYKDQLKAWKNGEYRVIQFPEDPQELKNIANQIIFKK